MELFDTYHRWQLKRELRQREARLRDASLREAAEAPQTAGSGADPIAAQLEVAGVPELAEPEPFATGGAPEAAQPTPESGVGPHASATRGWWECNLCGRGFHGYGRYLNHKCRETT